MFSSYGVTLSVLASIFDPLGLIAPITARIKTIFQLLCKDKLNWDDIIPPDIALVWDKFLDELKGLQEIRQHRYVFDLDFPSKNRIELHRFSDSSKSFIVQLSTFGLLADGIFKDWAYGRTIHHHKIFMINSCLFKLAKSKQTFRSSLAFFKGMFTPR